MSSPHHQLNLRIVAASMIGSTIEWFDYFIYGTLSALIFAKIFFPKSDPTVGLMLSYLTFSMSFFVRPLGGLLFAHVGDRYGRKRSLVATLAVMGVATALIGLLPGYAQIGVAAPALLILLRLLQGIGLGGEWGGALLLSFEYAKPQRRGFAGSFPQAGVTVGMLLSTFTVSILSLLPTAEFSSWGWRIPFLISVALIFFGLWIRHDIDETPDFRNIQQQEIARLPVADLLRDHLRPVLVAIAAKAVETGPFYIFTVFVISYATNVLGYSKFASLNAVTIGAAVATVMIPLYGFVADRLGRRAMFVAGSVLTIIFAVPYFLLLGTRIPLALIGGTVLLLGIIWPMITSVLGTLLSDSFAPKLRYSGITLGYQAGAALVGGTSPLIATWLLHESHDHWQPIALYIAATALISILGVGTYYKKHEV